MSLRPFSLGHALLLQRLGNPLAFRGAGSASARLGDVSQALMVCSRDWKSGRTLIDTSRERWWLAYLSFRIQRRGLDRARDELRAYLEAAWPVINWWNPTESRTRSLGAELLQILVNVQRRMGATLEGALSVPLAIAYWDSAAEAERSGAISLRSAEDAALAEVYDDLLNRGILPKAGTVITRN